MDIDSAVDAFWKQRQLGGVPEEYRQRLATKDGFLVQIAIQKRYDHAGDPRIGWKVAATSQAVQQQLGINEPAFGSLRQSRKFDTGYEVDVAQLVKPHAECEICFQLNENIAHATTPDEVRNAVSICMPAFELIEKRVPISDFGGAMADNAEHTAVILGKPIKVSAALDFSKVECELLADTHLIGRANGSAVLGDPLNSILWIKNRLDQYGEKLTAGMLIMTGSFLKQHPISPGSTLTANFSGIGSVSLTGRA